MNYWNDIKKNTTVTDSKSGGYYLDFDNGKSWDEEYRKYISVIR